MDTNYLASNRNKMNRAIHEFFVAEIKKEFKDDFSLISSKLDKLVRTHTIRDVRAILKEELRNIKGTTE